MSGHKLLKQMGDDEPIVSMIQFKDNILIATTKRVFKLVDDQFIPLDLVEYVESKNTRAGDDLSLIDKFLEWLDTIDTSGAINTFSRNRMIRELTAAKEEAEKDA